MAGRGRPRTVDQADVRDLIVTVRMNQAEYRQLQARAIRARQSIGEFVRALVAGGQLEQEGSAWAESLADVVEPVERETVERGSFLERVTGVALGSSRPGRSRPPQRRAAVLTVGGRSGEGRRDPGQGGNEPQ